MMSTTVINAIGTACFGAVIGWCIYYSLRRWSSYSPSQLGVLITAVLGSAVSTFFSGGYNVGAYGIGVALGFFSYAIWAQKHFNNDGKGETVFMAEEKKGKKTSEKTDDIPASDVFGKE